MVFYKNVGNQYRKTKNERILFHGDIYEEMDAQRTAKAPFISFLNPLNLNPTSASPSSMFGSVRVATDLGALSLN